jgi:hypothetical protein
MGKHRLAFVAFDSAKEKHALPIAASAVPSLEIADMLKVIAPN